MKLIELKCPACGATLKADSSREFIYCEYCGNKLLLDDEATHVKMSIDNARETGFEFEQGRIHAQLDNSQSEAEKIRRMCDIFPRYEKLKNRYDALNSQYNGDNENQIEIAPILGWLFLCFILVQQIKTNFHSLINTHDLTRIPAILLLAGIISLIVYYQYYKFTRNRQRAENAIKEKNSVMRELIAILKESGLDSIPKECRTMECLKYLQSALISQASFTIPQAVHSYELYRRQVEIAEQNRQQIELQKQQLQEIQAMREKMEERPYMKG